MDDKEILGKLEKLSRKIESLESENKQLKDDAGAWLLDRHNYRTLVHSLSEDKNKHLDKITSQMLSSTQCKKDLTRVTGENNILKSYMINIKSWSTDPIILAEAEKALTYDSFS